MAKLTEAERAKLPNSAFALPGRLYPIPDSAHARDALARASEELKKYNITKAEYDTIVKKANEVLDTEKHGTESFGSLWSKAVQNKTA